jgi:outer membrane immunogenic protein
MKWLACVVALSVAGGTAALAADFPPYAPLPAYIPLAPPYLYNWSGFYIGGNLGAGWSNAGSAIDTFGSTFGTTTSTSFLGGGQVGVNYELWSFFVIGAEVMFDWLGAEQPPFIRACGLRQSEVVYVGCYGRSVIASVW